ncbi:MAG: hypothetical protein AAGA65_18010 [Actinomycetota bacterium]
MAKKPQIDHEERVSRFEYRVWGKHTRACRLLAKMADEETRERVDDCYLLVDDPSWNAKVRDDTLKVKELIAENRGFERWASSKHRSSDDAPSPFDELYEELDLDRVRSKKPFNLSDAVAALDPDLGVRAVFVTKRRRRYQVGSLRAEVTNVKITDTGESLRTVAIEGDDLDELVALRKKLGLRDEPNTPVHRAIGADGGD